jgi:hypothetical protein
MSAESESYVEFAIKFLEEQGYVVTKGGSEGSAMNIENAADELRRMIRLFGDQLLADELERRGYVIAKPGDPPPEVEYTIHDKLANRMDCLASDLCVIDGMTKRDGRLTPSYINQVLPAVRRYAERVFDALAKQQPVRNDWDRSE